MSEKGKEGWNTGARHGWWPKTAKRERSPPGSPLSFFFNSLYASLLTTQFSRDPSPCIGQNGQNGSDLNMSLMGVDMNAEAMTIEVTNRGKSKSVVSFNTPNQFILFRAAGGDAGDGGRGGKGGTGGEDT